MTDKIEPIQFRMSDFCYEEFVAAMEASGVENIAEANAAEQTRATVALGWQVVSRTRPDFTFKDAMRQSLGTFTVVAEEAPEVSGADDGVTPLASPAPGLSTLPT